MCKLLIIKLFVVEATGFEPVFSEPKSDVLTWLDDASVTILRTILKKGGLPGGT